jgi:hypothetical protein
MGRKAGRTLAGNVSRPRAVHELLHSLIEKCEVALRKDVRGWHFSASGGLGVGALLIIVLLLARIL